MLQIAGSQLDKTRNNFLSESSRIPFPILLAQFLNDLGAMMEGRYGKMARVACSKRNFLEELALTSR